MKYFLAHASQWLSWKNIASSVHAKVTPYTAETVKSSKSLTEEVDVRSLLQDRRSRLKHFFTIWSKEAPSMTRVQPSFWKSIDNHNRSTERRIGKYEGCLKSNGTV